jgi:hypothetical protein
MQYNVNSKDPIVIKSYSSALCGPHASLKKKTALDQNRRPLAPPSAVSADLTASDGEAHTLRSLERNRVGTTVAIDAFRQEPRVDDAV